MREAEPLNEKALRAAVDRHVQFWKAQPDKPSCEAEAKAIATEAMREAIRTYLAVAE